MKKSHLTLVLLLILFGAANTICILISYFSLESAKSSGSARPKA